MTTVRVTHPDPLLPEQPAFEAYELHSFACDPPPGWKVTAVSDRSSRPSVTRTCRFME